MPIRAEEASRYDQGALTDHLSTRQTDPVLCQALRCQRVRPTGIIFQDTLSGQLNVTWSCVCPVPDDRSLAVRGDKVGKGERRILGCLRCQPQFHRLLLGQRRPHRATVAGSHYHHCLYSCM